MSQHRVLTDKRTGLGSSTRRDTTFCMALYGEQFNATVGEIWMQIWCQGDGTEQPFVSNLQPLTRFPTVCVFAASLNRLSLHDMFEWSFINHSARVWQFNQWSKFSQRVPLFWNERTWAGEPGGGGEGGVGFAAKLCCIYTKNGTIERLYVSETKSIQSPTINEAQQPRQWNDFIQQSQRWTWW